MTQHQQAVQISWAKTLFLHLICTLLFITGLSVNESVHANGGIIPEDYPNAALINEGRRLFFYESFEGNGRTCGSCHEEDNNFTIDAKSISRRSADDPLFVAERGGDNPLSENFENPELMHKLGLIKENTNGFNDLENNFTMRSVPHMLAMRTSLTPPTENANDGTTLPPDQRTGWGGDGAPVDSTVSPALHGRLRDFTVGAIKQHFPKTLNREVGKDFREPTVYELDALEAFMLSLGRQQEYDDFNLIRMRDERADMGRRNYMGEGVSGALNCNACHFNGGANTDPNFNFPPNITAAAFEQTNRSFAPRVEELLNQPGDFINNSELPFDDGFGDGTNLFNVPTVIEAADTGPFFHSNQIDTVEAMVSFYATQRVLRDGSVLPPIVGINGSQVANIGAFLRVLNADENARSAIDLIVRARQLDNTQDRSTNVNIALSEIEDALEVLNGGNLHFADAVLLFEKAKKYLSGKKLSDRKLKRAVNKLKKARLVMIDRSAV